MDTGDTTLEYINQVYSSITLTLATLRWCERHIVNQCLKNKHTFCKR